MSVYDDITMAQLARLRRPWRTFISSIKYDDELTRMIYLYYADRLDITLELHCNVPPPMVHRVHKTYSVSITPVTLYSIKFWMGTNKKGYPVASQLQFIMRVMVTDRKTGKYYYLFVELIANRDERRTMFCKFNLNKSSLYGQNERLKCQTHVNGYRSYAKDPLVFLTMIQASNEEREALKEMMRAEGIRIPLSSSSSSYSYNKVCQTAKEKLLRLKRYFNRHYYFRYMMFDNIQWELTRDAIAFEAWLYGQEWSEYAHEKRIQHEKYCLFNDREFQLTKLHMKPSFKFFFRRFVHMYDCGKIGYTILWNKDTTTTYRVFSDCEEEYSEIFCGTDHLLNHVDRVYHVNQFGNWWHDDGDGRNMEPCVNSYGELIARMHVKNYGKIYFEMIIVTYSTPFDVLSECILFLTRDLKLFVDIIQTGNKDEIYSFIVRDEGLSTSPHKYDNRLRAICTRAVTSYFLDVRTTEWGWTAATLCEEMVSTLQIPDSFKYQFIDDELKWSLMVSSWKRAVEDLTLDDNIAERSKAAFMAKSQKLDKLIDEKIAVTLEYLSQQGCLDELDIYTLFYASLVKDPIINLDYASLAIIWGTIKEQ